MHICLLFFLLSYFHFTILPFFSYGFHLLSSHFSPDIFVVFSFLISSIFLPSPLFSSLHSSFFLLSLSYLLFYSIRFIPLLPDCLMLSLITLYLHTTYRSCQEIGSVSFIVWPHFNAQPIHQISFIFLI